MEKQLDQYLQEMSIEEEIDKPLVLSNQPKFSASERNQRSILGRFLNPENQRMANWILEMPRIWRLYDRVRGIALSRDRFQFIFKHEEDINEILKTGVWTQDDWGVVMERWVEDPPSDYLMFLPVWIRLRNIPVNHYTKDTITELAGCLGQVLEVPFDESDAQSRDFVCVRVLLDLSKGLRNFKELQLPNGTIVKIGIDYERIRKRCFQCQRLTHDKPRCPFIQSVQDHQRVDDRSAVTKDLSKGKEAQSSGLASSAAGFSSSKVLADAIKADRMIKQSTVLEVPIQFLDQDSSFYCSPSTFCAGSLEASSSKSSQQVISSSKRPRPWLKNSKGRKDKNIKTMGSILDNNLDITGKSDAKETGKGLAKGLQRDNDSVVPGELPQDQ
ncbi:PREDICTED: uncharacterized protein LOC109129340 [Camelina sativa]|uniref:Uncharacterized protein LOC109129340 n=1 Tax=Camelina sativa TaxID=90675 RepID=A0ABM1R1S6_CAMSA|nr:PREDICTED: uncharacterized protein LOC109129340 [Camelina sativa]